VAQGGDGVGPKAVGIPGKELCERYRDDGGGHFESADYTNRPITRGVLDMHPYPTWERAFAFLAKI